MSVVIRETYYNKKPYGQWKNRFIYTMFGLFAGMIGVHDFYAKRRKFGYLHILVSVLWIVFLSVLPEKLLGMDSDTSKII